MFRVLVLLFLLTGLFFSFRVVRFPPFIKKRPFVSTRRALTRTHTPRARDDDDDDDDDDMSFKDRNPLSLSVPRHALNKLASEMEREEAKERKRREDAMTMMSRERRTTSADENNNNNNAHVGRRRRSNDDASNNRIDNVFVDRNQPAKLAFLTIEDLKKKAKPWREFFSTDHLRKSYRVPRTREEMYVRFDRNVYEYLGNYRRCSWIIALALLYKKPKAIAGGVVILKLYEVLQVLGQTVAIQDTHKTVIQFFVQVLIWVVSIVTRVFASLSMAVAVVFTMLGLHAILRRLDAPKPSFKKGKRVSGVVWETKSPREMNNSNNNSNRGGIGGIIGSVINRNKTQRRT